MISSKKCPSMLVDDMFREPLITKLIYISLILCVIQVKSGPGSFISSMGGGINISLTNVGRYKVRGI